jgi:hypothetical protein
MPSFAGVPVPCFCTVTTRPPIVSPGSATTTPFTTRGSTKVAVNASPGWFLADESI